MSEQQVGSENEMLYSELKECLTSEFNEVSLDSCLKNFFYEHLCKLIREFLLDEIETFEREESKYKQYIDYFVELTLLYSMGNSGSVIYGWNHEEITTQKNLTAMTIVGDRFFLLTPMRENPNLSRPSPSTTSSSSLSSQPSTSKTSTREDQKQSNSIDCLSYVYSFQMKKFPFSNKAELIKIKRMPFTPRLYVTKPFNQKRSPSDNSSFWTIKKIDGILPTSFVMSKDGKQWAAVNAHPKYRCAMVGDDEDYTFVRVLDPPTSETKEKLVTPFGVFISRNRVFVTEFCRKSMTIPDAQFSCIRVFDHKTAKRLAFPFPRIRDGLSNICVWEHPTQTDGSLDLVCASHHYNNHVMVYNMKGQMIKAIGSPNLMRSVKEIKVKLRPTNTKAEQLTDFFEATAISGPGSLDIYENMIAVADRHRRQVFIFNLFTGDIINTFGKIFDPNKNQPFVPGQFQTVSFLSYWGKLLLVFDADLNQTQICQ